MPPRRPRDDDADDRPRRRRDEREDEDDDRPRSRRRDDDSDDFDDRPRRRRRDDDYDDRPRRPRRRASGPSAGKVVAIVGGVLAAVALVVVVVLLLTGSLGGADISYEKFQAINGKDTLEDLEKKFGKAKKIDSAEAFRGRVGGGPFGRQGGAWNDDAWRALGGDGWYQWKKGSEEIIVATGRAGTGRTGLILKVYFNADAARHNGRFPNDPTKWVAAHEAHALY